MPTEIRPVTAAEAVEYLRALPQATGLPMWEPAPAAWYSGNGPWPAPSALSEDDFVAEARAVTGEGYHSQAAFVDGRIVGASATLSLELTVPGGRSVTFGGVTSTGVLATHRRRGLLRGMIQAMFRSCRERGEVIAGLSASEGSIYGRYGFSPATFQVRWELERGDAAFATEPGPAADLELVSAEVVRAAWPTVHERVRAHRVGEVSARPGRWSGLSDAATGPDGPSRFVVHRDPAGAIDGLAHFRTPWSADPAQLGILQVEAMEAATPAAYAAIWRLLADFDLTRRVVAGRRPVDEPLRWMLANPRALRVTRSADNLWLRILDVPAALAARAYDAADSLVLAVDDPMVAGNSGPWRLVTGPAEVSCRKEAGAAPDVALSIQALGSIYLGGVSAAVLAAAGSITELTPGAVARLSRLFHQDRAPFNTVGF